MDTIKKYVFYKSIILKLEKPFVAYGTQLSEIDFPDDYELFSITKI